MREDAGNSIGVRARTNLYMMRGLECFTHSRRALRVLEQVAQCARSAHIGLAFSVRSELGCGVLEKLMSIIEVELQMAEQIPLILSIIETLQLDPARNLLLQISNRHTYVFVVAAFFYCCCQSFF